MSILLDNPERLKRLVRLEYERSVASADLGKRSLKQFLKDAWPIVEPGIPFVDGWCIGAICEHMQAVTMGQIRKIVVTIPPRHTKSTTISVVWPDWDWLINPGDRFLCASYKQSLAMRDNRRRRNLIADPWFQLRYGHIFRLASDQKMKGLFENDKKGFQMAVSVAGSATGDGGSKLVIDDPHSADDAHSDAQRETAVLWFREVWSNRLNNAEKDAMVVVGQRIHENDVCGHILKERPDWVHLDLPAEYEPARKCFTPIGWSDPRTVEGELLWPERFSKTTLDSLKRDLGTIGYAAQYQQRPMPAEGGQFQKSWFRSFTTHEDHYALEMPEGVRRVLISNCWLFVTVDLAVSLKQTADYTVISTWAVTPDRDLLLIDRTRERLDNPSQQKHISLAYHRHNPDFVKVENVAYQLALIQQLRKQGLPVREYRPVRDKVSRATTASVYYEAGKVYHPAHVSWLGEWEEELLMFPNGAHDDQVDTVSMACEELGMPGKVGGMALDVNEPPTAKKATRSVWGVQAGEDDDYDEDEAQHLWQ